MTEIQDELDYAGGGLPQETNWWGAFVIGLAGTILVTGIAPVMVTYVGAASIPSIVVITLSGWLLCLFLAELSAMMPERTGGSPSYAYPAFKTRWPRFAEHVNGFTAWAYWLGWFPVGPLNMILASFYIVEQVQAVAEGLHADPHADRVVDARHLDRRAAAPVHPGVSRHSLRRDCSRPCSGIISMIPLTFVAIGWIFHPSATTGANVCNFHQFDGSGFFSSLDGHGWLTIYIAFAFLLTWNVIAMEAAACYIGECKDPERDAKIAMNARGRLRRLHLHADPDLVHPRARREGAQPEQRPGIRRRSSSTSPTRCSAAAATASTGSSRSC